MDVFGSTDSRKMPRHLFWGALHVDHDTAIRADTGRQNYSVCPRHWYVDAVFKCASCELKFTWTAAEQKVWFEDYFFWIDSSPNHCRECSRTRRRLKALKKEYDASIDEARNQGTPQQKQRIVEIIGELEAGLGQVPGKLVETREVFQKQLAD